MKLCFRTCWLDLVSSWLNFSIYCSGEWWWEPSHVQIHAAGKENLLSCCNARSSLYRWSTCSSAIVFHFYLRFLLYVLLCRVDKQLWSASRWIDGLLVRRTRCCYARFSLSFSSCVFYQTVWLCEVFKRLEMNFKWMFRWRICHQFLLCCISKQIIRSNRFILFIG